MHAREHLHREHGDAEDQAVQHRGGDRDGRAQAQRQPEDRVLVEDAVQTAAAAGPARDGSSLTTRPPSCGASSAQRRRKCSTVRAHAARQRAARDGGAGHRVDGLAGLARDQRRRASRATRRRARVASSSSAARQSSGIGSRVTSSRGHALRGRGRRTGPGTTRVAISAPRPGILLVLDHAHARDRERGVERDEEADAVLVAARLALDHEARGPAGARRHEQPPERRERPRLTARRRGGVRASAARRRA